MDKSERGKRGVIIIDLMGDDEDSDQSFEVNDDQTRYEAENNPDRMRIPMEPALEIVPVDPT